MKHSGWHLVVTMAVAIVGLSPSEGRADIIERDLGVDGAGNKVTGYVYQAGRSRSISRKSRLGPRVSSGTRHHAGTFWTFGAGVNRAPILVTPRTTAPVFIPYRVRFCRTASFGLAPQAFRAVHVGGRFSFKLGF